MKEVMVYNIAIKFISPSLNIYLNMNMSPIIKKYRFSVHRSSSFFWKINLFSFLRFFELNYSFRMVNYSEKVRIYRNIDNFCFLVNFYLLFLVILLLFISLGLNYYALLFF